MTVAEAVGLYGVSNALVNNGDTLTSVCRRLYKTDDDLHIGILKALNVRYDWDCMEPGTTIVFLEPENVDGISEIW